MPTSYAHHFTKWGLQGKALAANAAELPFLEPKRLRLGELWSLAQDLVAEQAALTARKQEVSKRLAEIVAEGRVLSTFLTVGVREHFGNRSEKLVEFGLQPFRSRPRVQLVGPDGKPLKRSAPSAEEPAPLA